MERLQAAWRALTEVIAAPGANLRPALLLGALVFLLIVVLLVSAVLAVAVRRDRRRKRRARLLGIRRERMVAVRRAAEAVAEGREPAASGTSPGVAPAPGLTPVVRTLPARERPARPLTPRQRLVNVLVTVWLPVVVVVAAGAASFSYTGGDRYCSVYCHGSDPVTTARSRTAHAGVACVACHEDPAPEGIAGSISIRALHLAERATLVATVSGRPVLVPTRRCLVCHAQDLREPTEDLRLGVRMSHSEPLAAGMSCDDCHTAAGHAVARVPISMAQCLPCHDNRKASSECRFCHLSDTSTASSGHRLFAKTNVGVRKDCGGCHDQRPCDACHGLRLPHPDGFVGGGHARAAAFEGKRACFRCHTQDSCSACHLVPAKVDLAKPWGHPADWRLRHGAGGPASMCSCHELKRPADKRGQPFCTACHAPAPAR